MPHQCIGCGNIIPSGDEQILQGCGKCGGKKFYFTATALSEDERARVRQRADNDIDQLLNEVFQQEQELSRALAEGGLMEEEWVKVTPTATDEGGDVVIEGAGVGDKAAVPAEGGGALAEGAMTSTDKDGGPAQGAPKPVRVSVTRKRPVGQAAPSRGASGTVKGLKPHLSPEVIHMIEPGVYEIDLERLLDRSPIIVNRDGTYLIHLPSVFKGSRKRSG
jgi:predicted  nucleic acid-binding Zn-ribbon protein